jgi:phospholipase C
MLRKHHPIIRAVFLILGLSIGLSACVVEPYHDHDSGHYRYNGGRDDRYGHGDHDYRR